MKVKILPGPVISWVTAHYSALVQRCEGLVPLAAKVDPRLGSVVSLAVKLLKDAKPNDES